MGEQGATEAESDLRRAAEGMGDMAGKAEMLASELRAAGWTTSARAATGIETRCRTLQSQLTRLADAEADE